MSTQIQVIVDLITVVVSLGGALFVAGVGIGGLKRDVKYLREQIAEIKGMFIFRLKDDNK